MYVYVKQSDISKMGSAWKNREEKSGFFFLFPLHNFLFLQIWRKSTPNVIFVRGTHSSTRRGETYFDRDLFMKIQDASFFSNTQKELINGKNRSCLLCNSTL